VSKQAGFKCIGCDRDIGWDGEGTLSYTCVCGSRIFYQAETLGFVFPASLMLNIAAGRTTPHLGDIVGESDFTSPLKESLIEELRSKGFTWMEECDQCKKDGTLQRKQEREKYLATREAEAIIRQAELEKGGK